MSFPPLPRNLFLQGCYSLIVSICLVGIVGAQDSLNISLIGRLPGYWETANDVATLNDTLILVNSNDYGLAVMNFADPDYPTMAYHYHELTGQALEVKDNILYLLDNESYLKIYYLDNLEAPEHFQTVDLYGSNRIWIEGNILFSSGTIDYSFRDWARYFYALDIRDSDSPAVLFYLRDFGSVEFDPHVADGSANDSLIVLCYTEDGYYIDALWIYSLHDDSVEELYRINCQARNFILSEDKLLLQDFTELSILDISSLPELDTLYSYSNAMLGGTSSKNLFIENDTLVVYCDSTGCDIVTLIDLNEDYESSIIGHGQVDQYFRPHCRAGRKIYGIEAVSDEVQVWNIHQNSAENMSPAIPQSGPMLADVYHSDLYTIRQLGLLEKYSISETGSLVFEDAQDLPFQDTVYCWMKVVDDRLYLARHGRYYVDGIEIYGLGEGEMPEYLAFFDFEDRHIFWDESPPLWSIMSDHILALRTLPSRFFELVNLQDLNSIESLMIGIDDARYCNSMDPYAVTFMEEGGMIVYETNDLQNIDTVMILDDSYLWSYPGTVYPRLLDYKNNKLYVTMIGHAASGTPYDYTIFNIEDDHTLTLVSSHACTSATWIEKADQIVTDDVRVVNGYYRTPNSNIQPGIVIHNAETGDIDGYYPVSSRRTSMAQKDSLLIVGTEGGILILDAGQAGLRNDVPPELEQDRLSLPFEFGIEEAYPNPFNPTLNVVIAAPQAQRMQITVFDILGRNVMSLDPAVYQPGYHPVHLDFSHYPSGVYFVRLDGSRGMIQAKKVVLLK